MFGSYLGALVREVWWVMVFLGFAGGLFGRMLRGLLCGLIIVDFMVVGVL